MEHLAPRLNLTQSQLLQLFGRVIRRILPTLSVFQLSVASSTKQNKNQREKNELVRSLGHGDMRTLPNEMFS